MTWPERIAAALKPGRWFVRHYTSDDVATTLKISRSNFTEYVGRARRMGLVVTESWGPLKTTYRLQDAPVCVPTRVFLETYERPHSGAYKSWLSVTDHERDLGLKTGALNKWLVNHDLLVVCPKPGKERLVPPAVLEYYLEQTTPKNVNRALVRPEGYVNGKRALVLIDANEMTLRRAVARGEVRAVRVGGKHYFRQSDLETLNWSLKDKPLPGWELVLSRTLPRAADNTAALDWLTRNGHETRKYRTETRQLGVYALSTALDLWEQHHKTYSVRVLTPEQVRQIKRDTARSGDYVVAKVHGIHAATVRGIRLGRLYRMPQIGFAELYAQQQAQLSETARRIPASLPPVWEPPAPAPKADEPAPLALPEPAPPEPLEFTLSRHVFGGLIDAAVLGALTGLNPHALSLAAYFADTRKVQPRQGKLPRRVLVRWGWAQEFLDEIAPGWRALGGVPEWPNGGVFKTPSLLSSRVRIPFPPPFLEATP